MGLFEKLLGQVAEEDRAVFLKYPSLAAEVDRQDEYNTRWEQWKDKHWDDKAKMTRNAVEIIQKKDFEIEALKLLQVLPDIAKDQEIESLKLKMENAALRAKAHFDSILKAADAHDLEVIRKYPQLRLALEEVEILRARGELDSSSRSPAPISEAIRAETSQRGLAQVMGMKDLKEQLLQEVVGPLRKPDLYRHYRVSLPNGILFYGPPGCGKTYIAEKLAQELGYFFQHCRPSDVASPYIHDTVSKIRELFEIAIDHSPSVLFIDEFEAFAPPRADLGGHQQYKAEEVNEFLKNLEGCAEQNVLVIAATNEPEKVDPAVRRAGRFDKVIFIPPPDVDARRAMLQFHLDGRPLDNSVDVARIAATLEGYSAADIKLLTDEAARMALANAQPISMAAIQAAQSRVPRSIRQRDLAKYAAFRSRGA